MSFAWGCGSGGSAPCVSETDVAFCTRVGKNCGAVSGTDNCGTARSVTSCGSCISPQTCAAKGTANVCETPAFSVGVTFAGTGAGTVTSNPSGVACGTTCSASFDAGTALTLTASPANGSIFSGFSGDCTGASCSLTMGAAKSVTATFAKVHTLTVRASSSGSGIVSSNTTPAISCTSSAGVTSGTCSVELPEGTAVTLTPAAAAGSRFDAFSNACTGASCSFTLNSDATASTSFIKTWDVSVTFAGSGGGTVAFAAGSSCTSSCTRTFDAATALSITGAVGTGNKFSGFTGDYTGPGPYTIASLSANQGLTATFVAQVDVNVAFAGAGSGTVDFGGAATSCTSNCTRTFDAGTNLTLGGAAGSGSTFSGFAGECAGNPNCTMTSLSAPPKNVTATFATAGTYSIGGTVTGLSGTGFVLANQINGGAAETLTIWSNGGFVFPTKAPSSGTYAVTVNTSPTQPDGTSQTCTVTAGGGTATADVTTVQVDCTPFVVAGSLYGPASTKVYGSNVYFSTSSNASCYAATGSTGDNLMLVAAAGGTPAIVAAIDHSAGNCGVYGIVFDAGFVYWANYADGIFKKATLAGASVTTIFNGPVYTNSFAIDPAGGYLYYFGYSHGKIDRVSVAGTGSTEFTAIGSINGIGQALDASYLYWTDSVANTVNKASLTATLPVTSPTNISNTESSPTAPFVTSGALYWINPGTSGALRYATLPSGSPASLASSLPSPGSVVADANFAWVLASGTGPNYTDGRIYKVPVGGGPAVIVAKNLNQPNSISMDPGHLYWANFGTSGQSDGAIVMIVK